MYSNYSIDATYATTRRNYDPCSFLSAEKLYRIQTYLYAR